MCVSQGLYGNAHRPRMQYQGIGAWPLQGLFVFLYNHDRTDFIMGKDKIVRRTIRCCSFQFLSGRI
jgi:hypothetical protein